MDSRLPLPWGLALPDAEELLARAGRLQALAIRRAAYGLLGLRAGSTFHGGGRVPYWASGGPEHVVLLHGFGAEHSSFLPLALRLRAQGRGLVLLDLPGFGEAEAISAADNTAQRQAGAVLAVLDALAIGRAHLVGSSMGGGVALRCAADAPERVASVTGLGSVGPLVEHNEVSRALLRGECPLVAATPEEYERVLALVVEKPIPLPRTLRAYWGQRRAARAPHERDMLRAWLTAEGTCGPPWDVLESLHVPTLWIHGAADRIVHPSSARALAQRIPGATLELLPGVGHVPQIEATGRVASLFGAFAAAQATKAKQKK